MRNQTRYVTLGAVFIALLAVLQIFNNIFGQAISGFAPFVYPIIFIIYAALSNRKWSLWMLVAALLTLFILSPLPLFLYLSMYALMGFSFGLGVSFKLNNIQLVIWSTTLILIINLISIFIFGTFFGFNLQAELVSLINLFGGITVQTATYIYYGVILVGSLLEATVIYMIVQILFHHLKLPRIKVIKLKNYQVTNRHFITTVIVTIISMIFYLIFDQRVLLLISIAIFLYCLFILLVKMFNNKR